MSHKLRVEVDREVCIGSGECVRLAPGAFALGNDNIAVATDTLAAEEETLRQVEMSCPSGAISVTEEQAASSAR